MMNMRIRHMPLEGGAWLLKSLSHCDFWIVPLPYPPNVSSLFPTCYSRNTMAQHRAYLRTLGRSESQNLQWGFFTQNKAGLVSFGKKSLVPAARHYHSITLSHFRTITLSHFQAFTFAHFHTIKLSHYGLVSFGKKSLVPAARRVTNMELRGQC